MNEFYYETEIAKRIQTEKEILIYGAGVLAKTAAFCLTSKPYNCSIKAFLVSNKENNPTQVLGKRVIEVGEGKPSLKNILVVVVAMEKNIPDIQKLLQDYKYSNIIFAGFESDLWSGIRGNFYKTYCIDRQIDYRTLEESLEGISEVENASVHLYTAKCSIDKKIQVNKDYPWEIPIQVGAALTSERIASIRDNDGDNISDRNRNYCELTALYWIWKNDKSSFAGLGHYRRHFDLSEQLICQLENSSVDVILPIPIINYPSVREIYEKDHLIEDWDIMLQVLDELYPEYHATAMEIQDGIFYYAYNMLIARKEIFDEYCSWLFPILFECEQRCNIREDNYQTRYLGFLAERLLSIFFLHNWNKWEIVHANKNFLS